MLVLPAPIGPVSALCLVLANERFTPPKEPTIQALAIDLILLHTVRCDRPHGPRTHNKGVHGVPLSPRDMQVLLCTAQIA